MYISVDFIPNHLVPRSEFLTVFPQQLICHTGEQREGNSSRAVSFPLFSPLYHFLFLYRIIRHFLLGKCGLERAQRAESKSLRGTVVNVVTG